MKIYTDQRTSKYKFGCERIWTGGDIQKFKKNFVKKDLQTHKQMYSFIGGAGLMPKTSYQPNYIKTF